MSASAGTRTRALPKKVCLIDSFYNALLKFFMYQPSYVKNRYKKQDVGSNLEKDEKSFFEFIYLFIKLQPSHAIAGSARIMPRNELKKNRKFPLYTF